MDETTGAPEPQSAPPAAPTPAGDRPGPASDTSKILAALGYVFWIVALVAILIEPYKDEKFVKFHAIQALAYGLALWVLAAVTTPIFGLGVLIWVVGYVYAIILAVKAFGGNYVEVPVLYGFVKSYIGE